MYTEEPKREINWGSVIKKGLIAILIIAIILLVIWLFTRNRSNKVNVDYNNNSNINETINSNSYSGVFIDNYRYFHDTAKEYFLVSSTLPANGKSLRYTLQELIDKGLILPFAYKDKETCDFESSYVLVKNNNGKYVMTTYLVCGKENAKTTEELGCNQLCPNGNCNKVESVTQYQYKQPYTATETTYKCPSGYTQNGTKCTKNIVSTIAATKTVNYDCPSGTVKTGSGSNTKCYTKGAVLVPAQVSYTYSCPYGYNKTGNGENTRCTKPVTTTVDAVKGATTYSCPSGYDKTGSGSNTKCTKTTKATVNATAVKNTTYSCPSGYDKIGSGSNTKCSKPELIKATPVYSCANGYSKNGNSCIKYIYTDISYGTKYHGCTGGTLVKTSCGANCTKSKYEYKCTTGVSTSYTCPSGYDKTGSGSNTKCMRNDIIDATANTYTTYKCNEGTLSGTKCIVNKTTTANPIAKEGSYSCKTGNLSGSKCIITTTASTSYIKSSSFYCKPGYGLSGKTCYKTTDVSVSPYKNITYTCQNGYDKVGTGSSSICKYNTTSTINATKSTKKITKYRYQWSAKTSIDGWEKTGKTRTVEVSSK